jgi:hypothetical protein
VPSTEYNEAELIEWYVNARSDGWACEAPTDESDHWKEAILYKDGHVAEIDIPGGTLVVYLQDRTKVHEPIPYNHADFSTRRRCKSRR